MLRKIYRELVAIRKELQAVRSSLEPKTIFWVSEDSIGKHTGKSAGTTCNSN